MIYLCLLEKLVVDVGIIMEHLLFIFQFVYSLFMKGYMNLYSHFHILF